MLLDFLVIFLILFLPVCTVYEAWPSLLLSSETIIGYFNAVNQVYDTAFLMAFKTFWPSYGLFVTIDTMLGLH